MRRWSPAGRRGREGEEDRNVRAGRGVEIVVGLFVVAGVLCLAHMSVRLARREVIRGAGYEVQAVFADVGGLRVGAPVTLAGVDIGRVKAVTIQDYNGLVSMQITARVPLQADAIASVRTRGLIGERYITISPGGDETLIGDGGQIVETEPAVDFEQLISKLVFGKGD
ncbi:MAG: outer membrane lipid asymmetry maintenance protein MlaD [Lentisphaeria bacterium]|nr:outer membrane lipid asymmetry maintenance protein MlaD [Lentisphaeria bacterium]